MPKTARHTTGSRIENHFLDLLEFIYTAYYSTPEKKNEYLILSIHKTDLLKFLLQIAWENKLIKQTHYGLLSDKLYEIGKMFGGWKNNVATKTKTP